MVLLPVIRRVNGCDRAGMMLMIVPSMIEPMMMSMKPSMFAVARTAVSIADMKKMW